MSTNTHEQHGLGTVAEAANLVALTAREAADKARIAAGRGNVTATRAHVNTLASRVALITEFFDEASADEYVAVADAVARTSGYLNDAARYLAVAAAAADAAWS